MKKLFLLLLLPFTLHAQTSNGPLTLSVFTNNPQFTSNIDLMVIQASNALPSHVYWEQILFPNGLDTTNASSNWIPYKPVTNMTTNDYFFVTNATFTSRPRRYFELADFGTSFSPESVPHDVLDELDAESRLWEALQDPDSPESLWVAAHQPQERVMERSYFAQVFNLVDRSDSMLQAVPNSVLTNLLPQQLWLTNQ